MASYILGGACVVIGLASLIYGLSQRSRSWSETGAAFHWVFLIAGFFLAGWGAIVLALALK